MRRILTLVAVAAAVSTPALALAATPALGQRISALPDRPCAYYRSAIPGCFFAQSRAAAPAAPVTAAPVTAAATRLRVVHRPGGLRVGLAGPAHATRGQTVRYVATVVNLSHANVHAARLVVAFPRGLAKLSVRSGTAGCAVSAREVRCLLHDMRAAGRASVTVEATVGRGFRQPARAAAAAHARLRVAGSAAAATTHDVTAIPLQAQDPAGARHQAEGFTVTARITSVMCDGPMARAGARTASARLTTVLRSDRATTDLAARSTRLAALRLPATGAPLMPATIAALALLAAGALALAGGRARSRREG